MKPLLPLLLLSTPAMGQPMPANAPEPVTWCVQLWSDFDIAEEACHDHVDGKPLIRARPKTPAAARKIMLEYAGKIMTPQQLAAWAAATSLTTVASARRVEWYLPADAKRYVRVVMHRASRDVAR
jgi:hypothetical protein